MIRMGRFDLDPRTGIVGMHKEPVKNADEIFREVKARRRDLIAAHTITDGEIKGIITKVKGGTRNTFYLAPDRRLVDMAAYIVREYGWRI